MNNIFLIGFIIMLIIKNAFAYLEGSKTSTTYLSSTNNFNYHNITELVVFGDSLSAIHTNFNDMTYTGINNSKGESWTVHLANLNNMTLWNYSVSGACIDKDIVPRKYFTTTFREEYTYFIERMSKGRKYADKWNGSNTLFTFWLGTNDITSLNRTEFPQAFLNQTLDTLGDIFFTNVKGLYDTGARNFLIFNVQSINEIPSSNGSSINFDSDVQNFNEHIQKLSKDFTTKFTDSNIIIYNMMEEIRYIQEHYKDYGFINSNDFWDKKNLTEADIPKYIWIDGLHTTFKTNGIFADDVNKCLLSIDSLDNKNEEGKDESKKEEGNDESKKRKRKR